jgi:nucleotide-binding universal stress UspA family protein
VIDRIVVPVDFSPESVRALMIGSALADRIGADVELVAVTEPVTGAAVARSLIEMSNTIQRSACKIVESDSPTAEILIREVHQRPHDLWCVGSHARGVVGATLLGSISEHLVRHADMPVIIVGPHVDHVPGGSVIAVALDGSERSEAILPAIEALTSTTDMSLRLLQVALPTTEPLPADVRETAYLARVASRATPASQTEIDYDILHGHHPAEDIATYVAAHPEIGMIALATRGLTGRDRLLHGSVAFEIAHRAAVPVLILHDVAE